ncbi:hypothetical protein CerSpe_172950 [Prunus speciosa]
MPALAETLDGSSPFSQKEAVDDHALVSIAENANGSSPSSPLKALDDMSSDSSLPNPTGSSPSVEEGQEDEPSPPSPLKIVGNDLSNYESDPHSESSGPSRWSASAPSWSSRWSLNSTKESVIASDSQFSICETKPSMVGAGLANLGNTCFMNAILQCFTHTVPLVEGLRSCNHSMPCDRGSEGFCVLCALHDHVDLSVASSGRVISPWKLVENLNHFSSFFQRYQQEDAHEFLQCFLDKLEKSCLDSLEKESPSAQDNNLVERVFGGRLLSKLRCCNCGHCSDTYEPLIDLSLEIEDVETLPRALESFTKIETINDLETKFTCENCKEEVSVEKQLVVDQAPPVAAFHLKRFKTDGSHVEKIEKHVEFPLELDLKPYTSGSDSNVELKYELYAIVEHVGFSSTSGHYFCFIRSSPDTWHRLDDSKVTRVQEEFVLSQEAYILFYARQGTPWFSSIVESLKPCLDPAMTNTSPKSVLENVESASILSPSVNNVDCCAANETGDAHERITLSLPRARCEVVEVIDTRDAADGCSKETKDSAAVIDASTPGRASNSFDGKSHNNENICSTSSLGGNRCHKRSAKVYIHPMTPPRSPSPDLPSFESPEPIYCVPRDHSKSADNVACKRSLNNIIRSDHLKSADNALCKRPSNNDVDDSKRIEAFRYLSKKSLTRDRGSQLLAAMVGPQSEGSSNKRRKRVGSSPCKKVSPPGGSHKSICPVAAALR